MRDPGGVCFFARDASRIDKGFAAVRVEMIWPTRKIRWIPALAAFLWIGGACETTGESGSPLPDGEARTDASSPYESRTPTRDGTGRVYMGREISLVMGHRAAGWLERPERESEEKPDRVVQEMSLAPDDVVADVGAGTGYFSLRIAPRVPEGRVYAVDIQPQMLEILDGRIRRAGVENVRTLLGSSVDPRLPVGEVDAILLVDAYHEFSHPKEMGEGIARALAPGGRLYLVEYRGEDPEIPIKPLHKMTVAQTRRELEAVGLRFVGVRDFLPEQHFIIFEKIAR